MDGAPTGAALDRAIGRHTLCAMAVGSALPGALVVWVMSGFFELDGGMSWEAKAELALSGGVTTALFAAVVGRRALTSSRDPVVTTIGWSVALAVVNAPASLVAPMCVEIFQHEIFHLPSSDALVALPAVVGMVLCLASPASVFFGAIFGIAFIPLVLSARADLARPHVLAHEGSRLRCDAWIASSSAITAAIAVLASLPPLAWACLALAACGALLAARSAWKLADRRRWLAHVARGQVQGWEIVGPAHGLELGERVLARVASSGDGAYRTSHGRVPIGLVP